LSDGPGSTAAVVIPISAAAANKGMSEFLAQ
jgi:hypothetical protein